MTIRGNSRNIKSDFSVMMVWFLFIYLFSTFYGFLGTVFCLLKGLTLKTVLMKDFYVIIGD